MKRKVFVDTNVLISGIFFKGNESKLLSMSNIDLITSDVVVEELKEVVRRKLKSFKTENLKIALEEIDLALKDFTKIVKEEEYRRELKRTLKLISNKKDAKILAAALIVKADYLVTGDEDFFIPEVKKVINIKRTKEVLEDLKKILK